MQKIVYFLIFPLLRKRLMKLQAHEFLIQLLTYTCLGQRSRNSCPFVSNENTSCHSSTPSAWDITWISKNLLWSGFSSSTSCLFVCYQESLSPWPNNISLVLKSGSLCQWQSLAAWISPQHLAWVNMRQTLKNLLNFSGVLNQTPWLWMGLTFVGPKKKHLNKCAKRSLLCKINQKKKKREKNKKKVVSQQWQLLGFLIIVLSQ